LGGLLGTLRDGYLLSYVVASLFRVAWGYCAAVLLAIPFGLWLGWHRKSELSLNPMLQILRPISPLAWIPIAILLFGVGDQTAIFLIFLSSFFPLAVTAMTSVGTVLPTHVNVARNFGMSDAQILRRIVFPSVLPQLIVGMRVSLGVAWLVVVAAEMIAVDSGLGFLIIEARNAGDRYDLVLGGMALIGGIGVVLDVFMRKLEGLVVTPR
jgi:NitT/TauT family transport system permease protein